jgi:hypothetical protein
VYARQNPSVGWNIVFDSSKGPFDQFDAFVTGKKFGRRAISQDWQGSGQPMRCLLLVTEDGDCMSDYRDKPRDHIR